MDYQKVIEVINNHERYVGVKYVNGVEEAYVTPYFEKALDTAISAMQELQEYRKLGTLEEVRKAVEKQNAEKPKAYRLESHGVYEGLLYCCPNCGCSIIKQDNRGFLSGPMAKHCLNCGQKLNWTEVEK